MLCHFTTTVTIMAWDQGRLHIQCEARHKISAINSGGRGGGKGTACPLGSDTYVLYILLASYQNCIPQRLRQL